MSTDWHVHCVDCNVSHTFDDANHQDRLMLLLIKHADAIASLAALQSEDRSIELRTLWGQIEANWFLNHRGHTLMPIDEYGRLLDQCHERVTCECTMVWPCTLKLGHDGPHRHDLSKKATRP